MNKRAFFSILLAGIVWGTTSLYVKTLSAAGFDSMQTAFIKMSVAAILFFLYVLMADKSKLQIRLRDLWIFAGSGLFSMALFNAAYFYTIVHGGASVAVVLLYTSPVFVFLLSAVFFHEKITLKTVIVILMTVAGCCLVAGLLGSGDVLTLPILAVGLASGLCYGLYTIFSKLALRNYSAETMTLYSFLFGAAALLPMCDFRGGFHLFFGSTHNVLWGTALGIFSAVIPFFLYTKGLEHIGPGKAATIVAIEPVVGAVIGITLYKEDHSPSKIAGMILIILAILIINLQTGAGAGSNQENS